MIGIGFEKKSNLIFKGGIGVSFDDESGNFFELIRSTTPTGYLPEVIATRFPYDEVKEPFYYRFRKIESTIVHKTHMVYKLNDEKFDF